MNCIESTGEELAVALLQEPTPDHTDWLESIQRGALTLVDEAGDALNACPDEVASGIIKQHWELLGRAEDLRRGTLDLQPDDFMHDTIGGVLIALRKNASKAVCALAIQVIVQNTNVTERIKKLSHETLSACRVHAFKHGDFEAMVNPQGGAVLMIIKAFLQAVERCIGRVA